MVHLNEGIFLCGGGSLRRRNFASSQWFTAMKELSFIAVAHRDMIDLNESHTSDVQTFGYTPLKEGYQTSTLGCIDTPRSSALRLDHLWYLGLFEFTFVAVVHRNEGTFFCRSGSPWHEVPTFLKQKNYISEKRGVVQQIVGKKNPKKYVWLKKNSCPQKIRFMYLYRKALPCKTNIYSPPSIGIKNVYGKNLVTK